MVEILFLLLFAITHRAEVIVNAARQVNALAIRLMQWQEVRAVEGYTDRTTSNLMEEGYNELGQVAGRFEAYTSSYSIIHMEGDGWYTDSDTVSSMGIEEISLTVQGDIKKRQVDGPVKGYTDGITLVVEGDDRVAYLVSNWEPVNSETPKVEEQTEVPLRGEMEQLKLIRSVGINSFQ